MNHPLIKDKITRMRDVETGTKEFRELVSEVTTLIFYEATRDLQLTMRTVTTPIAQTNGEILKEPLAIVPILRAGLGMATAIQAMVPTAKVGIVGMYRDPDDWSPVEYYCKTPTDLSEREVFVVDPMLATGGTAVATITRLKELGAKNLRFLCVIGAPEGAKKLLQAHGDVKIYVGAMDQRLNDHGYIVPGLGDAGDRIFGTK